MNEISLLAMQNLIQDKIQVQVLNKVLDTQTEIAKETLAMLDNSLGKNIDITA